MKQNQVHGNCNKEYRRGPTSAHMFDQEMIFKEINLKQGDQVLDLGCGRGDYSLRAAEFVGDNGRVYALDIHREVIEDLNRTVQTNDLKNIKTIASDILQPLPFDDNSIDVALIVTVLHTLNMATDRQKLLPELYRIIKPGGRVITIDCKKEESHFGPSVERRIAAEKLAEYFQQYNFEPLKHVDLGAFYMYQFKPWEHNEQIFTLLASFFL